MKHYIVWVFLGLLVLGGCKGCREEVKPDLCFGKKLVNTQFKVKMGNRGFAPPGNWCSLIPCDTFNETSVIFDAPDGNQSGTQYEWQIGTEVERRSGSGFEVSFEEYLNKGNWEKDLPITLIIKTPKSECLDNLADTLKSVTRNLFFTNRFIYLIIPTETQVTYKGTIASDPKNDVILTVIRKNTGNFRGVIATLENPLTLYVGTKIKDTLMNATYSCGVETCRSYNHGIAQYFIPDVCTQGSLTNRMQKSEFIFLAREKKIRIIFEFWRKNAQPEIFDFVGEKI
jgi:hypothetical protein